jgi:hypothetical protein
MAFFSKRTIVFFIPDQTAHSLLSFVCRTERWQQQSTPNREQAEEAEAQVDGGRLVGDGGQLFHVVLLSAFLELDIRLYGT